VPVPALPPGSGQPAARNPANVHVSRNLLCCHSFLPNQILLESTRENQNDDHPGAAGEADRWKAPAAIYHHL